MIAIDASNLIYVSCHMNAQSDNFYDYKVSLNRYLNEIFSITGSAKYVCFFDKSKSFRSIIYPEYKAKRAKQYMKFRYDLTEYAEQVLGFIEYNGLEADDLCSLTSELYNAEIVGIDKDLKQISGIYWQYKNKEHHRLEISAVEAEKSLLGQVIIGDAVDNIPGLPGAGEKAFEQLVLYCNTNSLNLQQECMNAFVNGLTKPRKVAGLGFPQGLDMFSLNYKLVKLLNAKDLDKYGFDIADVKSKIESGIKNYPF